jgi:hypothetical protein
MPARPLAKSLAFQELSGRERRARCAPAKLPDPEIAHLFPRSQSYGGPAEALEAAGAVREATAGARFDATDGEWK